MIHNKSYIFAFIILLLSFQIACGQAQNTVKKETDTRLENLKNQADQLIDALNKNDFEEFVEMTHPDAVEKAGGKENLIEMMKQITKENPKIFESFSISIENPTEIVETEGKLFGVVPLKIEGVTHQKHKIVTNDCFVGVSDNKGKSWIFVSGVSFDEIFPSSKAKLKIIKRKTFKDGVEI